MIVCQKSVECQLGKTVRGRRATFGRGRERHGRDRHGYRETVLGVIGRSRWDATTLNLIELRKRAQAVTGLIDVADIRVNDGLVFERQSKGGEVLHHQNIKVSQSTMILPIVLSERSQNATFDVQLNQEWSG